MSDEINLQSFAKLPVSKITNKPVLHFAHANGMPSAVYEPFFLKVYQNFFYD